MSTDGTDARNADKVTNLSALNHPVVSVEYEGQEIFIDEEVAPLCQAIWKLGIPTRFSCQDVRRPPRPSCIQIVFPDVCSLDAFLSHLVEALGRGFDEEGAYEHSDGTLRMCGIYDKLKMFSGGSVIDSWKAELCNFVPGQGFYASLTFPKADLPAVMHLLNGSK